jgi:hypothetical protein
MSSTRFTSTAFVVAIAIGAVVGSASTHAQGGRPVAPSPVEAGASVPPARYESAFARYRPNAEVEVGSWREANDRVGRIGGWRVYGREATADPAREQAPAPARAGDGDSAAGASRGHAHGERR